MHAMEHDAREPSSLPALARLPNQGLLIELGPQSRSQIKRLKRGRGRLARQITQSVSKACEGLGMDPRTEVVPVVILYRRRRDDYRVSFAGS
jgi:hypothetical protein